MIIYPISQMLNPKTLYIKQKNRKVKVVSEPHTISKVDLFDGAQSQQQQINKWKHK